MLFSMSFCRSATQQHIRNYIMSNVTHIATYHINDTTVYEYVVKSSTVLALYKDGEIYGVTDSTFQRLPHCVEVVALSLIEALA